MTINEDFTMNSTRPIGRTSFSLVLTVAVIILMAAAMIPGAMAYASPAPVNLAGIENYTILAGTGISQASVLNEAITGDIAAPDGAMIGVSCPEMVGGGSTVGNQIFVDSTASGCMFIASSSVTTAVTTTRQTAFTDANGVASNQALVGDLNGMTLAPGVYTSDAGMSLPASGIVTLDAEDQGTSAVWIFQIANGLTMGADSQIVLSNGAQASNIFWIVTGPTALGANSVFNGNIIAGPGTTTIALANGATVNGRLMTGTDVTLSANILTIPTDPAVHPAPIITSIAPPSGSIDGLTLVTITGTDLTGASALTIGGIAATNVTNVTATSFTASTPAGAAGPAVDLHVTATSGTATKAAAYTYANPPVFSSAETNADGTRFILTFDKAMDDPTGKQAQFTFQNATGVKAFSSAAINGTSTSVIDLLTTTPAVNGDVITFSYTPGSITSTDGGVLAILTDQSVTNRVPAAPVVPTVMWAATNPAGTIINITFTKTMADPAGNLGAFMYQVGGGADQTFTTIALNATTTIIDLTLSTPVGAGEVVTVNYTAGTVAAADATILASFDSQAVTNSVPYPVPTMTGIDPVSGSIVGGTLVTITGTDFTGATAVTFDGTAATSFTVDSSTQISATTPAHAAGAVDVVVTTPGGTATGVGAYTYSVSAPSFTNITPASGPIAGSTVVSITGTAFTTASGVTFDGIAGTAFSVVNDTHIAVTTPAHAAGAVDVVVTTTAGTATGTGAYTYTGPPTYTGIVPASGTTLGGTAVTITGTNFVSGGSFGVTIGGAAATSVVRVDATHITAVTPAGTAGAQDVVITNNDGQSVTAVGAYTYVAPPTFTSITPNAGPTTGGTAVTIVGTNFVNGGSFDVRIGTTSASSVTWVSPTQITAVTPVGTLGAKNVIITNNDGQTVTGTNAYTYVSPPTFTSIAPQSGSTAGGNIVTITGTNFIGTTAVAFDGTPATGITVQSATKITATVPAHAAGVVDVTVTTPGGIATGTNAYTYVTPSTAVNLGTAGNYAILAESAITSTGSTLVTGDMAISPAAASYIEGFGLVYTPGNPSSTSALVTGNVYAADYAAPTPTTLTTAVTDMHTAYTAAMGATPFVTEIGSGNLGGMTLAPGTYKFSTGVLIPTDLTLDAQGNVDAVWIFQIDQTLDLATDRKIILSNGAQAKNVFWAVAGTTTLGANSVFNGIILDKTNIAFTTGATLNGRALAQTAVTLQSNPVNDPVTAGVASPTVTSIAPATGSTTGSDVVIITGTGFTGATEVTFNGTAATGVTVDSATQITATTPAGTAGAADIKVTTPDGAGTGTALFTYGDAPTFTSIAPASGSTEGGNMVIITGTGFTGTTGVTFDGIAATGVTVDSDTQITAITPAHAVGAVDVIVTTDVAPVTGANAYTYVAIPIPTISGIAPASGPAAGGTVVIITGADFTGATAVTFGGTAASSFTVDSTTQITATTAAHAAGAVNVLVTTPGGIQTAVSGFTFVAPAGPAPDPVYSYPYISSAGSDSDWGTTAGTGVTGGIEATVGTQLAPTIPSSTTWVHGTGPLTSTPFSVDIGNWLGVAVSWTTRINDNPEAGAHMTTVIEPYANQQTMSAYTTALHLVGLDIGNLAYVMIIQKSGIDSSGPATVTMNVPQDWVDQNGGKDAIRIVRFGDDGTTEVLSTSFIGYNPLSGFPTFEAQSPNGLSTFGLIAVIPYNAPAQAYTSGQQAPAQEAYPAPTPVSSSEAAPEGIPMMAIGGILAALVIIGIAGMTIIRRSR